MRAVDCAANIALQSGTRQRNKTSFPYEEIEPGWQGTASCIPCHHSCYIRCNIYHYRATLAKRRTYVNRWNFETQLKIKERQGIYCVSQYAPP